MISKHNATFFTEVELPKGLLEAVLARVSLARRRDAQGRLAALCTVIFISIFALVPIVQYAANEFYLSGFNEYASLFFDSISKGYWQEIVYSLIAALPSLAILLLTAIVIALGWSVLRAARNARIAFAR